MEKTSSLICSCSLHFLLLFLILFWPVNTVLDIEKNSYQVSLVTGKMGESISRGKTARPQPIPAKPAEPAPAPKVAATDNAVDIAKDNAKKEDKTDTTQTDNHAENQPDDQSSAALSALAELEKMLASDADLPDTGATGIEDAENEGGGIYDVYISTVMLAVKNSWSIPIYTRETFIAEIYVELDPSGNIVDMYIERSSGRADFDGSALNALERLGKLPAPPSPELQNLVLVFNSAQ